MQASFSEKVKEKFKGKRGMWTDSRGFWRMSAHFSAGGLGYVNVRRIFQPLLHYSENLLVINALLNVNNKQSSDFL